MAQGRTAVVVAAPGSGKSTRVPPALLPFALGQVLLLQPRRVAAIALAERIAREQGWRLGREVGYRVRFERVGSAATRLWVMTEGTLTRRLISDPYLEGVGAVVLDEIHERSIHTDLALAYLRELVASVRPELRVVAMSATIDAAPLSRFLLEAPVVACAARTHPVAIRLLPQDGRLSLAERVAAGVRAALADSDCGDVLAFLPGAGEIRACARALEDLPQEVVQLHGQLPPGEQARALKPGERQRVVLATNVAETSVTIPGVRTVVDCGFARVAALDPAGGVAELPHDPNRRASADQRAGRAGRTAPGRCLRLWSLRSRTASSRPRPCRRSAASTSPKPAWPSCGWATPPRPSPGSRRPSPRAWRTPPACCPCSARWTAPASSRPAASALPGCRSCRARAACSPPPPPRTARAWAPPSPRSPRSATCACAPRPRPRPPSPPRRTRSSALSSSSRPSARAMPTTCARSGSIPRPAARSRARATSCSRPGRPVRTPGWAARAAEPPASAAEVAALVRGAGHPDRVARRSASDPNRATMVGSVAIEIDRASCLYADRAERAPLLVAAELTRLQRGAHTVVVLRQGAETSEDELVRASGPLARDEELAYDRDAGRVVCRVRWRYRDLVVREATGEIKDAALASAELARALAPEAAALVAEDEAAASFLARARWLSRAGQEAWPGRGRARRGRGRARGRPQLLWRRVARLPEVLARPKLPWLTAELDAREVAAVEAQAPAAITVPSGRSIRLDYSQADAERPPVLAVRLQELFGLAQGPRIAGGIPVLLHLLAPNYRVEQITSDLASFWANTYALVRKDLRARYPKHAWPDDPLRAPPQARGPSAKR